MKTLKILIPAIFLIILASSCGDDDFGIDYELTSQEELKGSPSDTIEFNMKFTHEVGIGQIVLESSELQLDFLENFENGSPRVTRDFTIVIPEDAESGEKYEIDISLSEINGNSVTDVIEVEVE